MRGMRGRYSGARGGFYGGHPPHDGDFNEFDRREDRRADEDDRDMRPTIIDGASRGRGAMRGRGDMQMRGRGRGEMRGGRGFYRGGPDQGARPDANHDGRDHE